MSYQIIPNLIFIFAVLGILLIILRRLPEAGQNHEQFQKEPAAARKKLLDKGLPAKAISKVWVALSFSSKKIWNFILEAKDLKPTALSGYKMKKIFGGRLPGFKPAQSQPQTFHEVKNEQYYLDVIKLQPKNLANYDALGKFYLAQENINDAKDVYLYAASHEPANPEYQAKLAYCYYQTKDYAKAAEHYEKSTRLDSTQPNRYYNLGLALKAAGQAQAAKQAVTKALELEPLNPKYQQTLKQVEKMLAPI